MTDIFVWTHNWLEDYKIEYALETAVYQAENRNEFRRPLTARVRRKLTSLHSATGRDAQKIIHFLKENGNKTFYLPIYGEPFTPLEPWALTGLLKVREDTTYCWNLHNLPRVVLVDESHAAVKTIVSIASDSILVNETIGEGEEFTLQAKLYPVVEVLVDSVSLSLQTRSIASGSLTFLEYN